MSDGDILDVIVIGAGPAGLAAAAKVGEAGLGCLSLDAMGPGGQLMNLGRLHDCPDLPEGTTGPDLLGLLVERVTTAGVELGFGEVRRLEAAGDGTWSVATDEETWRARAVIVATGKTKGTTGLADEPRYEGRGLSHCANCDGPLYKDQPVVVHGGSPWALTEALELAEITQDVTLVLQPADLEALAGSQPERLAYTQAETVVRIAQGRIVGLVGEEALSAVDIELQAPHRDSISARALFLLAGRKPATGFLGALLRLDAVGAVSLDGAGGSTSRGGVFAAGDVVAGTVESIPQAIADGERAGQNAVAWVERRRPGHPG